MYDQKVNWEGCVPFSLFNMGDGFSVSFSVNLLRNMSLEDFWNVKRVIENNYDDLVLFDKWNVSFEIRHISEYPHDSDISFTDDELRRIISSELFSKSQKNFARTLLDPFLRYELRSRQRDDRKKEKQIPGYVYLLWAENGFHKIGMTRNIESRAIQLFDNIPLKTEIIHYFQSHSCYKAEKKLQNYYSDKNVKGEWFNLTEEDVNDIKRIKDYEL